MRRAKQKMRCRYNLPPLTDTTYKGNRKEGKIMKATGIVRRIDELGRVVIPKEIRRTMRIREGDPLQTTLKSELDYLLALLRLADRLYIK